MDRIISHYEILEKLGEGGMGVVYKAKDTKLGRTVALKFLPPHLLCDAEAKARFEHEAKAASALNHNNITTIHDIDEVEDQCFICMEHIEGKSLKEHLKEKSLSVKEVLDIAIQIGEGLSAAHKKDIVHRDIKSDNIMLTHEGVVKIMDFGLAKLKGVTRLTKTGSTLGTVAYMSPEQAQGMEVDQRSDIFSFGVVLYEMFTDQLPFKGEHEAAVIYSIVNETPESLARYKANVPEELQRIVDKALAKDREERYQHIDGLLADLKHERKSEEEKKLQQMEEDLRIARNIQLSLLPKETPSLPDVDIVGFSLPAREVGGDYYDFINIDQDRFGIVIADVSGKGMPAALLMANLQATLRGQALTNHAPSECVAKSNSLLCRSVEKGKFVTLFYGILNTKEKSFTYTNAGHCYPLIFNPKSQVKKLEKSGLILGMLDNYPYQEERIILEPGELILLFTDGITEAFNQKNEQFEEERLIKVVQESFHLNTKEISQEILNRVIAFQEDVPQSDDLTLVVVKIQ
jgi:serine phosphatase RsbU (regulator of sigma subunit)